MLKARFSKEIWREVAVFAAAIPIAAGIALSANAGAWSPLLTMVVAVAGGAGLVVVLALLTDPSCEREIKPPLSTLQLSAIQEEQRRWVDELSSLEGRVGLLREEVSDLQAKLARENRVAYRGHLVVETHKPELDLIRDLIGEPHSRYWLNPSRISFPLHISHLHSPLKKTDWAVLGRFDAPLQKVDFQRFGDWIVLYDVITYLKSAGAIEEEEEGDFERLLARLLSGIER